MECRNCEKMNGTCSVESLYAIGCLKSCPYINEPVLSDYGWIMNPPFTEKYQLSEGHIFLIPQKVNDEWSISWMITKSGSGSCGKTKPDLFMFAYKAAISAIISHHRITEKDKIEIMEIFDNKFDERRIFSGETNSEVETIPEHKEEYVSPFVGIEYGEIGEQLELF